MDKQVIGIDDNCCPISDDLVTAQERTLRAGHLPTLPDAWPPKPEILAASYGTPTS